MKKYLLLLPALLGAYMIFTGQSDPVRTNDIPDPDHTSNGKRIYELRGGGGIVAVNPSFKVFESPNRQFKSMESFTHPTNPNIFFTASVTNLGIGSYATTNGGYTWNGSDTLTGQSGFGGYFKPWITNSGIFYLGLARDLIRSTNNGATWTYAGSPPQLGHSAFGIDNNPSSPYFGRMYHVGQNAQGDAYGSYSTNDGVTWSTPDTIKTYSGVNFLYFEGFDLDIANDGRVYASYSTVNYDTPMEGPSFIVEISTSVSMSSNGGVDWTEPVGIGVSGVGRKNFLGGTIYKLNSYSKIAVDKSGGSRNGWIYVTETNRLGLAQDSADIILRRSTNNGATFPFSIRVNQDTPGNKKYQYMPAIKVDSYGGINIIYYDSREASQEDSVKVYMSRSVDGGNTWTDFPISERIFKPQQSATEIHSLGITESNNKIWPTWYSVESGVEQVWTAPVEIGPVIVHSKLGDNENLNGPYIVNAEILPNGSSIVGSETKVFWSRDGGPLTNSVTMSNSGGNNWSANIPGNGSQAEYRYYIITQDALGRASSSPFGAPAAFNTFHSAPDNSDPVIGYTPVSNRVSLQSLPFSIDAKINDNAYIDSAYVKWYKNDNPVPNNLLLNNIEHDRYIGQVDPGHVGLSDSIRFRIYAVDNSVAGNVDSTELYTLKFYDVPFVETFPLAGTNGEAWNSSRWTGGGTVIHRIYNNLSFRFPSEPALGYSGSPATLKPLDLSGVPGSKLSLLFHVGWDHNSGVDSLIITYKDTNNVFKYLTGIQGPFNVFNPYPALEVEFPPDVNLSSFQFRLNSTGGMFFDNIQVIRQINNDNIVLGDNFTIPFLNQGNWNPGNSSFRVIDKDSTIGGTFPYEVPSAPYFLSVRGDGILESKTRDLSGFSSATIFMKHSEHDLETDEKVYLEYFDGTRAWQQLIAFTGTDNNSFVPFSDKALVLPANALHSDFKLRFRSEGLESDDEWLFDNIFINQGIFTGNEISGNSIPQIFELHQNFPNPFNPITRIKFDIPKHSFVKLKIFDILGREVANLVSSEYFPGSYSVDFNASKFSSGAYFYRLEAGDFVQTKKMLLLK